MEVDSKWLLTRRSFEYLFLDLSPFGGGYKMLTKAPSGW
jgi:hypothetical protein